jgi:hypothetical protein
LSGVTHELNWLAGWYVCCHVSILVAHQSPLWIHQTMIICCGEALIDFIPIRAQDGTPAYSPKPGGSPYNVALTLGRLGVRTGFMSGISEDFFGSFLKGGVSQTTPIRARLGNFWVTFDPSCAATIAAYRSHAPTSSRSRCQIHQFRTCRGADLSQSPPQSLSLGMFSTWPHALQWTASSS